MFSGKHKFPLILVYPFINSVSTFRTHSITRMKVEKAYLFGSYARGKAHKESDIDLAIVSSSFSGNSFSENVALGKLTLGINTRIEPIGFTPKDFDELMFAKEIKKIGIEIKIN